MRDGETERKREGEAGREGDKESAGRDRTPPLPCSRTPHLSVSPSPPLPVSPSRDVLLGWLWRGLNWGLFILILYFVGQHALRLWGDFDAHPLQLRWGWLAIATVVSIVVWLPSLWFWRRLLVVLGWRPPRLLLTRAYYCSHPAKYAPGKALVIVLRATFLKQCGIPAATTAYTVTLETLTYMAAGAVTAVLLLPAIVAGMPQFRDLANMAEQPMWRIGSLVVAIVGSVSGLAVLSRLSVYFAGRMKGAVPAVESLDQPISMRTFAHGMLVCLGAWWLHGALLGLTLQAL